LYLWPIRLKTSLIDILKTLLVEVF
jgi:hypothetical protein